MSWQCHICRRCLSKVTGCEDTGGLGISRHLAGGPQQGQSVMSTSCPLSGCAPPCLTVLVGVWNGILPSPTLSHEASSSPPFCPQLLQAIHKQLPPCGPVLLLGLQDIEVKACLRLLVKLWLLQQWGLSLTPTLALGGGGVREMGHGHRAGAVLEPAPTACTVRKPEG